MTAGGGHGSAGRAGSEDSTSDELRHAVGEIRRVAVTHHGMSACAPCNRDLLLVADRLDALLALLSGGGPADDALVRAPPTTCATCDGRGSFIGTGVDEFCRPIQHVSPCFDCNGTGRGSPPPGTDEREQQ